MPCNSTDYLMNCGATPSSVTTIGFIKPFHRKTDDPGNIGLPAVNLGFAGVATAAIGAKTGEVAPGKASGKAANFMAKRKQAEVGFEGNYARIAARFSGQFVLRVAPHCLAF